MLFFKLYGGTVPMPRWGMSPETRRSLVGDREVCCKWAAADDADVFKTVANDWHNRSATPVLLSPRPVIQDLFCPSLYILSKAHCSHDVSSILVGLRLSDNLRARKTLPEFLRPNHSAFPQRDLQCTSVTRQPGCYDLLCKLHETWRQFFQ